MQALLIRILFPAIFLISLDYASPAQEMGNHPSNIDLSTGDTIHLRELLKRAAMLEVTDPDSSLKLTKTILESQTNKISNFYISEALYQTGKIFTHQGQYDSAEYYIRRSIEYLTEPTSTRRILPILYNLLGYMYEKKGEYELSADMYIKAALMAETINQSPVQYYSNLALILMRLSRYDQALYYLQQAKQQMDSTTHSEIKGAVLANLGLIYYQKGDKLRALPYLVLAHDYGKTRNIPHIQHVALLNMSVMMMDNNQPLKALSLLRETFRLQHQVLPIYHNATLRKLGECYLMLKAYDSADYYLLPALEMATKYNIPIGRLEVYQLLSKRYEETNDFRQAYDYLRRHHALEDSLLNLESANNIDKLEVKYRTAQKEKENAESKLLITQQQNRLIRTRILLGATGILLFVISGAFLLVYRYHRKLQSEKIGRLEEQQKISLLQAMMQGEEKERKRLAREFHDGIGGMLASVKMHLAGLYKQHPEIDLSNAISMIDETAHEVRKTSHNLMPELLYRNGLIKATQAFCSNLSKDSGLQIEFQAIGEPKKLNRNFELFLYRTIQELMQNVIKHASATYVLVQISAHDRNLSILVEDNGVGFNPDVNPTGMGINNLLTRTKQMNGHIHFDAAPGVGTSVYIEFDLNNIKSIPDE